MNYFLSRNCYILLFVLFFFPTTLKANSLNDSISLKISRPEIIWAVFHPFKIHKALLISKETIVITDSIANSGLLVGYNGGKLDAFKHCLWSALLCQEIGKQAASALTKAHEKGNRIAYRRTKKPNLIIYSIMDAANNQVGIEIGSHKMNRLKTIFEVIDTLEKGKLLYI